MKKPWTGNKDKKLDLNFLLVGNSGSGKTHFSATYTKAPIHFYMLDKGGEKTLEKLLINRPDASPLSIDDFSTSEHTFSDFWKQLQQDAKDDFFDEMAEKNGIVVIDSLTSANAKAIIEVTKKDNVIPSGIGIKIDHKKGMNRAHWGQLLSWMTTLITAIQELPCATITTVHLHTLMNSGQEVVARYPSVSGQFRQTLARDYDETYLLETRGENHVLHFKEREKFMAKSRVFSSKEARNYTLDMLIKAYLNNQTELPPIRK